jgi:hypothetical protein
MTFIDESWIFDEYRKAFRYYTPPIYAQEQMLDAITDRRAWATTCHEWAMNDYKPSSVGKMIDYYNKVQKTASRLQIGAHDPNRIIEPYAPTCERCKDLGWVDVKVNPYTKQIEHSNCPECQAVTV